LEWLVPGYLEEKIVALLKTLPKELRVQFVPAPDTATAVARLLAFGHGPLLHALAWQLGRMTGVNVPEGAWQPEQVPDWLRMNFRVVDEAGKTLAAGRDLDELRRRLKVEVRQTFEELPAGEWRRDDLTRWDFGDLPEEVEICRPGITVKGYPALVDRGEGKGVSLRLLESPDAAATAMRGGLRRLFMLQLGQEIKYLARNLPGIEAMCLHYAPVGPCDELRRDLLGVITDRAIFDNEDPAKARLIRTRDEFAARAESGWRRLSAAAQEVCGLVGHALETRHALAQQLSGTFPPLLEASVRDMREQLAHLTPRGFVASTPYPWLRQLPRFLKGIEVRLKKLLNAGAARDAQGLMEIRPPWEAYLRRAELQRDRGTEDAALTQYRWLLEELRVSLFAQELKTSVPVSTKRIAAVWAEVKP
jgi:ATP-dependent helicase HrpA